MIDSETLQHVNQVNQMRTATNAEQLDVWFAYIVFSWHWWLSLALAVLPWVVWFIVHDRKKTFSLLCAGFFAAIIAFFLDMSGLSLGFWKYNTWLLPFCAEYLPWDLAVMPVVLMLYYQFFPKVKPWLKGIIFAVSAAFIVEPVFEWLGLYQQITWRHYYSLPIYFLIYMAGYWFYIKTGARKNPADATLSP